MDLAEAAVTARIMGDQARASDLFARAFEQELIALQLCETEHPPEPTYSVLHRSAASLALDCQDFRQAERLLAKALSGNPPAEIASELRDLLEKVYFTRHLDLRGITLDPDEFQMSLAGNAIGYGMALSNEFIERIGQTSKIIYRIVDRKQNKPFREAGRLKKAFKEDYELFISVPRAASFAVSLKIGRPKEQLQHPILLGTDEIIDEMFTCLDLVNQKCEDDLKQRIPDEAYYHNFLGLSRQLAPDGDEIKLVGFTALHHGQERRIAMTRSRDDISIAPKPPTAPPSEEKVQVQGRLLFADAVKDAHEIKLVDEQGKQHHVSVPPGMMSDIVRPLWEYTVIVKGSRTGNIILLEDITKAQAD